MKYTETALSRRCTHNSNAAKGDNKKFITPFSTHICSKNVSFFKSENIFSLDGCLHHPSLYKKSGYDPIPQTVTYSKCSWNSFANIYLIHYITQDKNGAKLTPMLQKWKKCLLMSLDQLYQVSRMQILADKMGFKNGKFWCRIFFNWTVAIWEGVILNIWTFFNTKHNILYIMNTEYIQN